MNADKLFCSLLKEAEDAKTQNTSMVLHIMEVGIHSATQCLQTAEKDLQAHCAEPSPGLIHRINKKIRRTQESVRQKVKFYQ